MFGPDGPSLRELIGQSLVSTRDGYDLLAPKFDTTPFRTPDEIVAPVVDIIGTVDSVVDLCCGTGAAMRLLLPHCRRDLVGIDFSPGMIAHAERNLLSGKPSTSALSPMDTVGPEVRFVISDVLSMRFENEFDAAVCFGALGHIDRQDQALFLRGIYKALKPGGRFVFVTAPHPGFFSPVALALRIFNAIMRIRNRLKQPPFVMYYLLFLLPEARVMLEREGFEVQVHENVYGSPFQRYAIVVATKP